MSEPSFFSRWAKRKAEVSTETAGAIVPKADATVVDGSIESPRQVGSSAEKPVERHRPTDPPPLPTIESLTADSDFAPFMAKDVAPDMRNQAMKKLFTDPHYNVMDGLDIYIDDYGKPDPLPEGWLQLMNQSKTLRLFETAEEEAARLGVDLAAPQQASIAASAQSEGAAALDDVALSPPAQLPAEPLPTVNSSSTSAESRSGEVHSSAASESKLT